MGTDDIIKDFFYNNDGGEEDLADWTRNGSTQTAYSSAAGLFWSKSLLYGGYYQKLLQNAPTEEWEVTFIIQSSGQQQSTVQSLGYIQLSDGNYYCVGYRGLFSLDPKLAYAKKSTRPTEFEAMTYTTQRNSGFCVITMRFKTNGWVDIILKVSDDNLSNLRSIYPTITDAHAKADQFVHENAFEYSGAKITEIGHIGNDTYGFPHSFSLLGMYIESDLPTPAGGTAVIGDIKSITAMKSLTGGAGAKIIEKYVQLSDIRENTGKSLTIQDTRYGGYFHRGEIEDMRLSKVKGSNRVIYNSIEGLRKLTDQFCDINPVEYIADIQKTLDSLVYDEFAGWTTNEFAGKLITTKDRDQYSLTVFPNDVHLYTVQGFTAGGAWTLKTPDNTGGAAEYLYFYRPDHTNDVIGSHYINEIVDTDVACGMEFDFKVWLKDGTVFDTIKMKSIIRFTSLKSTKVEGIGPLEDPEMPFFELYNVTEAEFTEDSKNHWNRDTHSGTNVEADETWHTAAIEAADGTAGKSPVFNDEFDLLILNDMTPEEFKTAFFDNESAVNASGFRSYDFRVRIKSPTVPGLAFDPKMEIHYLHIEFGLYEHPDQIKQGQDVSVGLITSNTDKLLQISDAPAWSIADFPASDGVDTNDEYIVSADIESILASIFAGNDFDLITDFGDDYTEVGEIENLTYVPIYDYVQRLASNNNWAFWYVPTGLTDSIKIADQFDSTGVTITRLDMIGYDQGQFTVIYSRKNIAEKIIVIGDDGLIKILTDGVDYNVDVGNTLGDVHKLYRDNEVYTQRNVDAYAQSKINVNASETISVQFVLDYNNPVQNYGSLDLGKEIALEIDEFSSAVDGNLLIEAMTYRRIELEARIEYVVIHAQKRVV